MKVLAGDIGGTKTLLQIADYQQGDKKGQVIFEQLYESARYSDFTAMLKEFIQAAGWAAGRHINAACFGVAGPVEQNPSGQSVKVTNLPWQVDTKTLGVELGFDKILLINDFQAVGYGIEALAREDLVDLQDRPPVPQAPRLVVGAGTGLGIALLVSRPGGYDVLPSEGGHAGFAPSDTLQVALLEYLIKRFGRAGYEKILCGPGLVNIYEFLRSRSRLANDALPQRLVQNNDLPTAITTLALSGMDKTAQVAVDLFIAIYGGYAGNLALVTLPYGGVYIAGGIAPKLIERINAGGFIRAFINKGAMSHLLEKMPVRVVMNPKVGLMGAALAAARL
ncbi:MAG: glucokinase [Gammaproteobacteria bacterium]|nr:glucokinase [Gammaproteobacteria bacterium]